jgi:general secretion pathway protein K
MNRVRQQRGSILVVVLFLAGLLGVFAAVAASVLSGAAGASRSFAEGLRAEEAMRAAIEHIVGQTGTSVIQVRGVAVVKFVKAEVLITARDEAARIDLNRAPIELLAGIFRQAGVAADVANTYAARVIDWRDDDDTLSPNGGAERAAYRAAGRIDGPRNGPFLHVAELALVLGIPSRVAAAVAPYLTVASGSDKINPRLADPPVLLSLPKVSEERVRDFLQQRELPGGNFETLISRLGSVQDFVSDDASSAVRFEGRVRLGPNNERRYEVVVAVIGGDSEPYRVIAWDANPPDRIRALP